MPNPTKKRCVRIRVFELATMAASVIHHTNITLPKFAIPLIHTSTFCHNVFVCMSNGVNPMSQNAKLFGHENSPESLIIQSCFVR